MDKKSAAHLPDKWVPESDFEDDSNDMDMGDTPRAVKTESPVKVEIEAQPPVKRSKKQQKKKKKKQNKKEGKIFLYVNFSYGSQRVKKIQSQTSTRKSFCPIAHEYHTG